MIGIATPLNSEEKMTMDPIVFCLRRFSSRNLSLCLAQARSSGAHRATKNQFMIDTPPQSIAADGACATRWNRAGSASRDCDEPGVDCTAAGNRGRAAGLVG